MMHVQHVLHVHTVPPGERIEVSAVRDLCETARDESARAHDTPRETEVLILHDSIARSISPRDP